MIGLLPSSIFWGGGGGGGGGVGSVFAKRAKEGGGHKNVLQINCQGREYNNNII